MEKFYGYYKMETDKKKQQFNETLPIGKQKEEFVAETLARYGAKITSNHDYRYDRLVEKAGKKFTVEVKFDDRCHETGNFAIECESWGKPSGIETTESDYWISIDCFNSIHCIKTSKLKELCKGLNKVQTGCEDSRNKVYLVKVSEFKKYLILLKELLQNTD